MIVGSGTNHFTGFSVILGSGYSPSSSSSDSGLGSGGDGNLSVILPAVLVPVVFVVAVAVIVSVGGASLAVAWWRRNKIFAGSGAVNFD